MKRLVFGLLVLLGSLGLAACDSDVSNTRETNNGDYEENGSNDLESFTLETLAHYDGREGRKAYVAVNGYVYDVSNSSQWPNGLHRNQHQAGQDLSDVINSSPHGESVLDNIPRIGYLTEEE